MAKKSLPNTLVKEIELKKKNRLKENGFEVERNESSIKTQLQKTQNSRKTKIRPSKLIKLVREDSKKVGSKTGGIKLYSELKKRKFLILIWTEINFIDS